MNRNILLTGIILVVFSMIAVSGCTSSPGPGTTVQTIATPATTSSASSSGSAQYAPISSSYINTANGISFSYPSSWVKVENDTFGVQDYGRNTENIVNFYVPGTNHFAFSVDIDHGYSGNLEDYFNTAIVALQNAYSLKQKQWTSTSSYFQLQISGNKAYRNDFAILNKGNNIPIETGSIIFTQVNGNVYIFTYSGDSVNDIVPMLKTITINPSPEDTTRSRV